MQISTMPGGGGGGGGGQLRSLLCNENGVVIAETVYRCTMCQAIFDGADEVQVHYNRRHLDGLSISKADRARRAAMNYNMLDFEENGTAFYNDDDDGEDPDDGDDDDEDDGDDEGDFDFINYNQGLMINHNKASQSKIGDDVGNGNNYSYSMELEPGSFAFDSDDDDDANSNSEHVDDSVNPATTDAGRSNRGGFVTCEVCKMTKFYSHISRRFGVFSCESCAKFFYRSRSLQNPKEYVCLKDGHCDLDKSPTGGRCKACLLEACLRTYKVDPAKHPKLFETESNASSKENASQKNSPTILSAATNGASSVLSTSHLSYLLSQANGGFKSKHIMPGKLKIKLPAGLAATISPTSIIGGGGGGEGNRKRTGKRRAACRQCPGCLAEDCGECLYCRDKPKFGGQDVKKQKCLSRRCHYLKSSSNKKSKSDHYSNTHSPSQ